MKAKRYMVAAAGLSVVLAVAPASALHAQTSAQDSAAHRTLDVPTTTARPGAWRHAPRIGAPCPIPRSSVR